MTIYKTVRGKEIDLNKLINKNELTLAVGNMKVNARGDKIGPGGKIIKDTTNGVIVPDQIATIENTIQEQIIEPEIEPEIKPEIIQNIIDKLHPETEQEIINKVLGQNDDNLIVSTDRGLQYFNKKNLNFSPIFNSKDSIFITRVNDFKIVENKIYAATNFGAFIYDVVNKQIHKYNFYIESLR